MKNYHFENWCEQAVWRIKYKPDRKSVKQELYEHMEDKFDELVAGGMSQTDAQLETVKSMGDADEIAIQLAAIHKPFLGYVLTLTKVFLILVLIVAIFSAFNTNIFFSNFNDDSMYSRWSYLRSGDILYYPDTKDSSEGYTFTITRAMESGGDYCALYFTVESFNIRPWIGCAELREFHAVDSSGNIYLPRDYTTYTWEKSLVGNYYSAGLFKYRYEMWLENFDGDVQWVDIVYDDYGRDIRLHIDLTEGVEYE